MPEIIDVHCHVHPTATAAAAFRDMGGQTQLAVIGDVADALATMDRLCVQTMVLLPIMSAQYEYDARVASNDTLTPDQAKADVAAAWSAYNAWARQTVRDYPGRFVAMVGIDPVLLGEDWARAEIEQGLADGARGLKIAPGLIGCSPADERMRVVWELADKYALPVVSQSGLFPGNSVGHPDNFAPVVREYPRLNLILAHAGAGAEEQTIVLTSAYPNVFVDTSVWLEARTDSRSPLNTMQGTPPYTLQDAADYFRRVNIDRVLFGTNYGLRDSQRTLTAAQAMPLSSAERTSVFSENFHRLFGAG